MKARTLSKIITKYIFFLEISSYVLHDQISKTYSRSSVSFKHNWCSKIKKGISVNVQPKNQPSLYCSTTILRNHWSEIQPYGKKVYNPQNCQAIK